MKSCLLFIAVFFNFSIFADFADGNSYEVREYEGTATGICPETKKIFTLKCRFDVVTPTRLTHFVDETGEAVKTILTVHRVDSSDGSVGKKVAKKKLKIRDGRSKKTFNLWKRTPFSKSFLKRGINRVFYTSLDKKKNVLAEDHFDVTLNAPGRYKCPSKAIPVLFTDCEEKPICRKYNSFAREKLDTCVLKE